MEDPIKLLQALKGESKHEPGEASQFYLPKSLNREFRKVCGNRNASKVLTVLIRNFLEDVKSHKP